MPGVVRSAPRLLFAAAYRFSASASASLMCDQWRPEAGEGRHLRRLPTSGPPASTLSLLLRASHHKH